MNKIGFYLIVVFSFLIVGCDLGGLAAIPGDPKRIFATTWQDDSLITVFGKFSAQREGQFYYTDFSGGKKGDQVSEFNTQAVGASPAVTYSMDNFLTGQRAALWHGKSGNAGPLAQVDLPQMTDVFVSFDFYPQVINDGYNNDEPTLMLVGLTGGAGSDTSVNPLYTLNWNFSLQGSSNLSSHYNSGAQTYDVNFSSGSMDSAKSQWNRQVMRLRLSDNDVKNGEIFTKNFISQALTGEAIQPNDDPFKASGLYTNEEWVSDSVTTLETGASSESINSLILVGGKTSASELKIWIDNLYINDSEERVEICDSQVYEQCTVHMIQPVVYRTTEKLIFSTKIGKLRNYSPSQLFIHIFNADGSHRKGLPLSQFVN